MADGKCGHYFKHAEQAATHSRRSSPAGAGDDERRRQKKCQQEQEMVCAFRDVPHAEAEETEEANRAYAETKVGPSICVSRLCNATCLLIVQLIERLLVIALLGDDADTGVA